MAATRTSRIELRADPERERRIRYAAELEHQSVSAFVLAAAAGRADEVIASAAATEVMPDFFDQLWDALDEPAVPNPALQRRGRADRQFDQR
jgi:uncharacterized protein (DUF1778 family)